jgi:2TM domain
MNARLLTHDARRALGSPPPRKLPKRRVAARIPSSGYESLATHASRRNFEHVDEALELEEARRHVRRKRIFYTVLAIWIALSLMWFAIDMLEGGSGVWFYWPMLGTGIGVAITGIVLLGIGGLFGADWERREVDKYLRGRSDPGGSEPS